MDSATNYPSCIKIPSTSSKQNMINTYGQKSNLKETLVLNNDLILLANQILGEGKWSHTITNQTIDFVESFMGKYVCGCVTFVKIQLQDGTFHEDMGYCYTEEAMKGLSIHCARIGSLTDAFKKVLSCFGKVINTEIQVLSKKLPNSCMPNTQKEDLHYSSFATLEPCAQSTPLLCNKNDEEKQKTDNLLKQKIPSTIKEEIFLQPRSKSPVAQIPLKTSSDVKSHFQPNVVSHHKEQNIVQIEQDSKSVSEEELLRIERKRKQMEKQAEYKRLMKEREQQKANENKKINPKY
ncbi:hypothetical protein QLX08_008538 [Tetragonisca angustula]|uniref:DNA repair protein RAD52 homolog n=1 Tax=Tetragonisca angustula TaxID=166442 RepID=A0AAW0ZJS2_9HYME